MGFNSGFKGLNTNLGDTGYKRSPFDAHLAMEGVEKINEAVAIPHFRVHTNRSQYLLHFSADSNAIKNIRWPQKKCIQ